MAWLLVFCTAAGAVGAFLLRPLLAAAGQLLIAEDPLAPADVIVVANADGGADALEAARLYREGVAARVLVFREPGDEVRDALRALGIPEPAVVVQNILRLSGVPESAIEVLDKPVDGTGAEAAALAAFARSSAVGSMLYITPRTHSARSRWFLRRVLPAATRVSVRSPRTDSFSADGWWHSRAKSRVVLGQYLHWVNLAVFGDLWADSDSLGAG